MSEKEYIRVTNRTRLGIALEVLKPVLPDCSIIQADELAQIIETLARWQADLFEEEEAE